MCGILGLIGSVEKPRFEAALHRLTHRGPDGFGVWYDQGVMLGHRRLAILDISDRGKQPFEVLDRYVVTFNGEIYNFCEIRDELEAAGFTFRSGSDTEVLVNAYAKWGPDCLNRFNGMWAFGIWDKQERSLFLARDRFGKKPLFYAFTKHGLVFGSEMKALCPMLDEVKPSEHFHWCHNNINDYEATDKCLIEGIHRFPAGHHATTDGQCVTPVQYWDTMDHLEDAPGRYEEQVERFRELFIDSCKLRMRSDVSIGTALSGGFDSSATIATMSHIGRKLTGQRIADDWQHAFVAAFPGTFLDETKYAKMVVDHLDINSTVMQIDPVAGIDRLGNYLYHFEELHRTSPIPMAETYKAIKQHGVTVTLDGHGADEYLASYGQEVFKAFADCGIKPSAIGNILKTYRGMIDIDSTQVKKSNYDFGFYIRRMGGWKKWIGFAVKQLLGKNPAESIRDKRFGSFNQHLFSLFHRTVLPTLLRNYDRYSMMSGVEIRMPFMDHRLVTYVFSLPWSSKIRSGNTKRVARDAVAPFLPDAITYRTAKIGFNTPVVDWMKGPWKTFLQDTMSSAAFSQCDLIDGADVRKQITHVIEDSDTSYIEGEGAWMALTPFLWQQHVLKPLSAPLVVEAGAPVSRTG